MCCCWHGASPCVGEYLHKCKSRLYLHIGFSVVISHLNVKANRCCLHNKTFLSAEWTSVLNFLLQLFLPLPHHRLPSLCVCSIWYLSFLLQRQRCLWLITERLAHALDWKRKGQQQEWNVTLRIGMYFVFWNYVQYLCNIFDWFTSHVFFITQLSLGSSWN